jgi:hypothetical protein
MKTVPVPKLTLSFSIDVEVEYNSFGGKTADEIADALQDELHDLLFELEHVDGVSSTLISIESND